jgi:hypothetical protein
MKQTTLGNNSSSDSTPAKTATNDDEDDRSVEYDPDDLQKVQYLRATIDPIPLHPRGQQLVASSGGDSLSRESVLAARLEQVSNQETPQPLAAITWEEAMLCMQSTFNDANFATTPAWVGAIKYTFQQYLSTLGMDPEKALPESFLNGPPLPATIDPDACTPAGADAVIQTDDAEAISLMPETDAHKAIAEGLRKHLKHIRDRIFLAEYYDDLLRSHPDELNVPKLVWKEAALANANANNDTNSQDGDGTQAGLGMF